MVLSLPARLAEGIYVDACNGHGNNDIVLILRFATICAMLKMMVS